MRRAMMLAVVGTIGAIVGAVSMSSPVLLGANVVLLCSVGSFFWWLGKGAK